jgi:hypothetical protein
LLRALLFVGAVIAALLSSTVAGSGDERADAARQFTAKWAGSDDTDGFLNDPAVGPALRKLLGAEMEHLTANLNVKGSVDLIGGSLAVNGNAPHMGTEEEAIVCVQPMAPEGAGVQAAIFSKGSVRVFANVSGYESLTLCVKDWITLVNTAHQGRFLKPLNVTMVKPH